MIKKEEERKKRLTVEELEELAKKLEKENYVGF